MIRILEEKDLSAVTELCNSAMPLDRFFESLLYEKIFGDSDYNRDLNLVVHENGTIAGFVGGVIREKKGQLTGYVKLLAVEPEFREKGFAKMLLTELEHRVKDMGIEKIRIMDSAPNYFMPGLDYRYTEGTCLLRRMGYEKDGENLNLLSDLQYFSTDFSDEIKDCQDKGFEIRRARESDKEKVYEMINKEWPPWVAEADVTFRHDPISLFIALKEGDVVGFSAYDSNNVGTGWFGPMGVLTEYRKYGLGQVVCKLCLAEIKKQGFHTSIIPWVGPVRFYSKVCNARNDRVFWTYQKQL